jgi:hypothetical protein
VSSFLLLKESTENIRMTKTNAVAFLYYRSQMKHKNPQEEFSAHRKTADCYFTSTVTNIGGEEMKIPPVF